MSTRKAWGLVMGLGIAVLFGREAWAQSSCFPPGGGGVPGQPGLPNWWSGTAPYDDPRWIGAYGFGHGTVKFDAMVEPGATKSLLLRWHIKPDPGLAAAGDQIWVGFYNTTTNAGTILKFTRDALVTTTAGVVGTGVMSATALTLSGGIWGSSAVPGTVSADARLDAFCGTVDPIDCDDWIVRLHVPTGGAGGIALGDTFKLWYEVDIQHGDSGTTTQAKWPNAAATVDVTVDPPTFPAPSTWNDVQIAGGGPCVAGIDIQYSDISVSNSLGTGTDIDVNSANTFHTKPINNTATAYNPNSIKARLRIADWGSAVGDSPRWITVPDPTCDAATGTGAAGSITGGTHFDLTCSWSLTAGQKCAYRPDLSPPGCTPDPGPRYAHQCIMAELSSTAAPIAFSTDSAWNNFDFGPASKLERKARLDIGTLSPRDVYVYVKAQNMPETVESTPDQTKQTKAPAGLSPAMRERMGALGSLVPGRVGAKEAEALRGLVAAGRLTYDDLTRVMPTYTAYVWHDTGTTVKTVAGTSKLLAPQPSFTLFVSHDGPLVGWKHAFSGFAGATVTQIARDFYRISVGTTGSVEVATSVEALEGGPQLPIPLWLLVLIIFILLIIIWIVRRIVRT